MSAGSARYIGSAIAASLLVWGPTTQHASGQGIGDTGRLEGRVSDAAGEPLVGATIDVRSQNETVATVARSGATGAYWVPALLPGRYSVEAAAPGHAGSVVEDVDLDAGETLRLDFTLASGEDLSFTITAAPTLDTVSASVPPARGPGSLSRLPSASAGDWISLTGGALAEPPSSLGLERARLHGAPAGSFRLRVGGEESSRILDDSLLLDHSELYFAELEARDLEGSPYRGSSLGGWVDAVPRWPGASWAGRVRLGWASDEPALVTVLAPRDQLAPGAPARDLGEGADAGAAGGGSLFDRRVSLYLGGGTAELDLDRFASGVARDAALARVAFTPEQSDGRVRLEAESSWSDVRRPRILASAPTPDPSERSVEADASVRVHRLALDWVTGALAMRGQASTSRRTDDPAFLRSALGPVLPSLETERGALAFSASRFFAARGVVSGEHVLEGGARYAENGADAALEPSGAAGSSATSFAAWLEDRWRLGRRGTFSLGLRAESQRARIDGDPRGELDLGTKLEPRIGGALDVYGDGTWKVYGVLSRGHAPIDPALLLPSALPLRIDPDAVAPSVFEAALGSEQLVVAGVVLSARIGYWRGRDPLLRLLRSEAGEPFVLLGNPARGRDSRAAAELPEEIAAEIELLQLALSARIALGEDWELGGDYSFSRADGALDLQLLGVGGFCGLASTCLPASGSGFPSGVERPHRLGLHGSVRFAPGASAGFVFGATEGTPFVPLRAAPPSEWLGSGHLVPDPAAAGADARNDAHAQLDLSAGWELPIGVRPYRIALELSAFNVFDERKTLERWPLVGSVAPAFRDGVLEQEGRWLRLDVRLEL